MTDFDQAPAVDRPTAFGRDRAAVGPLKSSVDTGQLFDDVEAFVRRFLVLDEAEHAILPLWIAHTYVFKAFDNTPYLTITSAEKGSGKSTLLDVLAVLVATPERADGITTSALVR